MKLLQKAGLLVLLTSAALSVPFASQAHQEDSTRLSSLQQGATSPRIILSRQVDVLPAEQNIGIVNIREILPQLRQLNSQYSVFKDSDFQHFVTNFHYPYRNRFFLNRTSPPAHIVLHWTANRKADNPLITLSAFLRRSSGGRIAERPNKYKNVSNYFLTGSLPDGNGNADAYLVKLTRGNLKSWGDIPRVTAYPTDEEWDDNKYDGRGAIGIEIDSPDFRTFYFNRQQRGKLMDFMELVLNERGVLDDFKALRHSPHWDDMLKLHEYLVTNLPDIDVNGKGTIPRNYLHLDSILKNFPDLSHQVYGEAHKMYKYISGHGIVAREYNERMIRSGRRRDASYDKIDFTEPHVFIVGMDLLKRRTKWNDIAQGQYDLATQKFINEQQQLAQQPSRAKIRMEIPTSADLSLGEFDAQVLRDLNIPHFAPSHIVEYP